MSALGEPSLAVRTLVSLVFLTAAYGKLRHFTAFQGVVANYRLLPDALATPAAYAIPPVEGLLGAALLLSAAWPWAELGAAGLLLVFALAMGINIGRGRSYIDCGCFQSALKQTLSWTLVLRNVVLSLLLGVALLGNDAPLDRFALVNGWLGGVVLFVILQALGILWSISPAWRRPQRGNTGASS